MATIILGTSLRPAIKERRPTLLAEFRAFWHAFAVKAFSTLPAGTALYARPRSGLPGQADGAVARRAIDARRYPDRQDAQAVLSASTIAGF